MGTREEDFVELIMETKVVLPFIEHGDGNFYFREFAGRIVINSDDSKQADVGRIALTQVMLVSMYCNGIDAFELGDGISHSLMEVVTDLCPDTEIAKSVLDAYEQPMNHNFLLIDHIDIKPQYRGQGIGGDAIKAAIALFSSSCGLVVLKPFNTELPTIGFKDSNPVRKTKWKALNEGETRLRRFYERLGFRLLTNKHMTFCTELKRQPTLTAARKFRPQPDPNNRMNRFESKEEEADAWALRMQAITNS